jgi:bifunctional ADP-heptose synthase (sugar kinase/adenylyltransferase)
MKYDTGFIAGCFDLLHPGYIIALKEAKSVCSPRRPGHPNKVFRG